MQVTEKLLKKIIETKYLSVDNTDRYRCIIRIFYLNYEKLRYWLYQEDIYAEMVKHEYFSEYTIEQCQQDLTSLVEWMNLVTIQDARKVSSIEEFKNKKFRYQLSEYSVEIERLVIKLENLFIEGASLEPTLLERIRTNIMKLEQVSAYDVNESYAWWNDLNNDFIRLNQNYQDYIRDLNSIKAEEMMKTKEFLVFKDRLIEYLRTFVKSLQKNVGIIESILLDSIGFKINVILTKVVEYELSIPRIDLEVDEAMLLDRNMGRWESINEWFVGTDGKENEAGKLFDATNEIIRRITRYATQISEMHGTGANRKEEYAKVASIFMKCRDMKEAHCLSAMVFGIDRSIHLKGDFTRETDTNNSGVYEEEPTQVIIMPRIRNYREKANRSPMKDYSKEKAAILYKTINEMEQNREQVRALIVENQIDFARLPVLEPEAREILLSWISKAFENNDRSARTEDGQNYSIVIEESAERVVVRCSDGEFTMPHMKIIFSVELLSGTQEG